MKQVPAGLRSSNRQAERTRKQSTNNLNSDLQEHTNTNKRITRTNPYRNKAIMDQDQNARFNRTNNDRTLGSLSAVDWIRQQIHSKSENITFYIIRKEKWTNQTGGESGS